MKKLSFILLTLALFMAGCAEGLQQSSELDIISDESTDFSTICINNPNTCDEFNNTEAQLIAYINDGNPETEAIIALNKRKIKHVFMVMLENRSFSNVMGTFNYQHEKGLLNSNTCTYEGDDKNKCPEDIDTSKSNQYFQWCGNSNNGPMPQKDPGEHYKDMTEQIFGVLPESGSTPLSPSSANMTGFVNNYVRQGGEPCEVMNTMTKKQIPVMWELAKNFGYSDRYFAALPQQTHPNRVATVTGTFDGFLNNMPGTGAEDVLNGLTYFLTRWPYQMDNLFERLKYHNKSYRVYGSAGETISGEKVDVISTFRSLLLSEIHEDEGPKETFRNIDVSFQKDLDDGDVASFTIVEPTFLSVSRDNPLNSSHPPEAHLPAEAFIAKVYNAIRGSDVWENSLLIVTFDEHGGLFDAYPPPAAPSPGNTKKSYPHGESIKVKKNEYNFIGNRLGARVPALFISPWVEAKNYRAFPDDRAQSNGLPMALNHNSITRLVEDLFVGESAYMTMRDKNSPSLAKLLTAFHANNGPERIAAPEFVPATSKESDVTTFRVIMDLSTCAHDYFEGDDDITSWDIALMKVYCAGEVTGHIVKNGV